jgi:type I restriction enzyme S subunit
MKVINVTNILPDGRVDVSNTDRYISLEEFEQKYRHFAVDAGDIVIASSGNSYGKIGRISQSHLPIMMNTSVIRLRSKNRRLLDDGFLFGYVRSQDFRNQIERFVTGSAQPNFGPTHIKRMDLPLPPLETQRRIAAILGAYDDLIEVNRRRVAVLEEMARGLFEEWFVRFRFPGHETVPILDTPDGPLPEGWRWENLYDAAEVSFGFAFKSKAFTTERIGVPVVRIRDVLEGRTTTWTPEPFDDRYWVKNGDLLIGMDGIFHTNIWIGGDAALNQRVTRLRPKDGLSVGWLFRGVLPTIKFFEATISGTTVAHLGAKHLKTIMLPRADEATQRRADAVFAPIDAQLVNLKVANERLAASRDLLLPRLISGQLSVEAAERELEAAA